MITKHTHKREFVGDINLVIYWSEILALIAPHAPAVKTGRPAFAIEVMLRIHLHQQLFGHSDPAMEVALHDIPLYRQFVRLDAGITRLPNETTILCFRHLREAHGLGQQILATINAKLIARGLMLNTGTVVDATLIATPSSTKKGNQWRFGMKAHVGVDVESGLIHMVTTTASNFHDVTQAQAPLHGQVEVVFADLGCRGAEKRDEVQARHIDVDWQIVLTPSKRKALDKTKVSQTLQDKLEKVKASIRTKVAHPFRVIKCQFEHRNTRYLGLAKKTTSC